MNLKGATFPIEYARGAKGGQGFLAFPYVFDFSSGGSNGAEIDLSIAFQDIGLDTIASAFIDCSSIATGKSFTMKFAGTNQIVSLGGGQQMYAAVLSLPKLLNVKANCTVTATSTAPVIPVIFLNKEMLTQVWTA